MTHLAPMTARLALAIFFVSGGSLSLAQLARAGSSVDDPFLTEHNCLSPDDVTGDLVDPIGFYAGQPNCESLCKKAAKDCAQYVNLAAACQNASIGDDASFAKQECEVEFEHGTESRVCKTEIEHASRDSRSSNRDDRDSALQACASWQTTCIATCNP